MIGYLQGTVKAMVRDTAVLMAGNVGYGVYVPAATLARIREGEPLSLWTHLAVRENAEDLYGFETKEELQWFELLLTVSSVGPRSALSILNAADPSTLERAIARSDASILTSAYGIGRKTAEKIVLELKDKIDADPSSSARRGEDGDVVEALITLGYSAKEARDAAHAVPAEITDTALRVREALKIASRG